MSMKPGSRTSNNRMNNGKSSSGRGGGRGTTGRGGTSYNKSERTPFLNGTKNGYGSNNDIDNTSNSYNSNNNEQKEGGGWFGQLVSIVTGKPNTTSGDTINDDDIEAQQQHIEEETKSYRDRANAFLKKTEKERLLLKEQKRSDEIHNVTVPVSTLATGGYSQTSSYGGGIIGHGGNHSRSKMSSMSAALDSIASCSDEEAEDDEEDTYYSSDDEESYYFENKEPTTRVWRYGDLPTTTTTANTRMSTSSSSPSAKKKKKKLSKHDVIMKRERILQEEYEYRLHSLKRENEKLSKRFRIFVLVTVALIFMGALAFALVVCFRMLMSI